MSVRRGLRRALLWSLPAAALAVGLLAPLRVAGETFHFRESGRAPATGKVLVEFEDLVFVALDGGATRFVARAELAAVEDAAGKRYEEPPVGAFARFGGATPAAAVTDPSGEVTVRSGDGASPLEAGGLAFLRPGDEVATGEAGLARVVLPSGAIAKLAPSSALKALGEGAAPVALAGGEAFLRTDLRALELGLAKGAFVRLGGDSALSARRIAGGAHLLLDRGRGEVLWADLRLVLGPGLGAELVGLGGGGWRLTADPANFEDLDVHAGGEVVALEPGASRTFGSAVPLEGEPWRLVRSRGEVLVGRGAGGDLEPVAEADRSRLLLGAGDRLVTGLDGAAVLGRVDAAQLELGSGGALAVGPPLALDAGELRVEAPQAPVEVATPNGPAALRMAILRLRPLAAGVLEVRREAGVVELPLGPAAAVVLEQDGVAVVSSGDAARVALKTGRASIRSRARDGRDPRVRVELERGDAVGAALDDDGALALELPGDRALRCEGERLEVVVRLGERPRLELADGGVVRLVEGLALGLGRREEAPELRFRSGPRLLLEHAFELEVHNPTVVIGPGGEVETTLALEGDVAARLQGPTPFAAAVVGARAADRLEVRGGASARLDAGDGLTRFAMGDGRQVWIEDGAPPVQARLDDAAGRVYVTVPGSPALGLAPARPIVVLVSADGVISIVDGAPAGPAGELLAGPGDRDAIDLARDRIPELLDVPPVDSPSGP